MSDVKQKLLTIAIPTYNRAYYLEILLNSILCQYKEYKSNIELIISDNASSDNTSEIINNFIKNGLDIKYYKYEQNLGPDRNIANCFIKSSSKYVWIIGDDDILEDNVLKLIFEVLCMEHCASLIYLGFRNLLSVMNKTTSSKIKFEIIKDKNKFIKETNFMLCYISTLIMNKQYLSNFFIPEIFFNTNLVQLSWVMLLLKKSKENIIIKNPIIIYRPDNTYGWGFFETARNFVNLSAVSFLDNRKIAKIFENGILLYWVSGYILKYQIGGLEKMLYENEAEKIFIETFRNNKFYLLYRCGFKTKNKALLFCLKTIWRILTGLDKKILKHKLLEF